jgi:TetR/AcrR family transcriptional regulator
LSESAEGKAAVAAAQPTGPPDAVEARERLLQAAIRLFAAKGFAATAVHEITNEAGVNRALLYYYFGDKQSLYQAVLEQGVDQFIAMQERSLAGPGSHSERLLAFIREHLELIATRGELGRVMHRSLLDGHQAEFQHLERFQGTLERLEDFFRAGMAAGEFRQMDPALTARCCIGPTFIFTYWRLFEGERFTREEVEEVVGRLLLNGLRADRD